MTGAYFTGAAAEEALVSYPCVKNTSKTMLASVRYPTGPIQDIGHLRIARTDVRYRYRTWVDA